MHFLLFMDGLRTHAVFIVFALSFCAASLMIWAPRMMKSWRKIAIRTLGSVLLGLLAIVFVIGVIFGGDPPREHLVFTSATGSRVALLSHSSFRDGAATQVTVKGNGCCRRYIAYDYYGAGGDYMGATSIKWVDDNHLTIQYARDPAGRQQCYPQVGNVTVQCVPQPDPFPAELR